ncbi:hypothetical protein HK100_000738 [Physocladia obscura]|uniref:pectinesterase n=1 Tax=Physocladia obscura TaxID=109957 RepID=A0AAD5T8N9_9FUNG|nr:hypothetical protein HK100_000738 [Physocladia obscura]
MGKYFSNLQCLRQFDMDVITTNGRASTSDTGGSVFNKRKVIVSAVAASGTAGSVYLGHPWYHYTRVVFINSELTNAVTSAGWSTWTAGIVPVNASFYEYNNYGSGNWNSNRASFSQNINDTIADSFHNYNDCATPAATSPSAATTTTIAPLTTNILSINIPPVGAITVSRTNMAVLFSFIQVAVNSLPDTGSAIIFVYSGIFHELNH